LASKQGYKKYLREDRHKHITAFYVISDLIARRGKKVLPQRKQRLSQ